MRRRYVVCYDVSSDRRRTKIFELLEGYGEHVQFSVFLADLTDRELIVLRGRLRELMNEREDQVLIVDLGRESRALEHAIEVLGRPYQPGVRSMIV
ncbi:MAG: CRISPR-associated endonuclease Cas2 [Gemmatimonadaceae bacterium]|nr:CRISPR-associated endonuclease Cas2 [Gemmatimonadaceae bacterium]